MYKEKLTIGGKKYVITHNDDGTVHEDPPLPKSSRATFASRIKDIVDSGTLRCATDTTDFHARRGSLLQQLGGDEAWCRHITKVARSQGAVITDEHTYISQLAAYPGDPKAFIPPGEGRSYVKKVCEEKGKSVSGCVEYEAPQRESKKAPRLADDLVQSQMTRYRQEGRVDSSVSDAALSKMVVDIHGAKE